MTAHVQLKKHAAIRTIAPAGIRILAAIDQAARYMGIVLTITSASERRGRAETDPHMTGEAFDVSVIGLTPKETRDLWRSLTLTLGTAFTVLLEAPIGMDIGELTDIVYHSKGATALHLHVQRKKGTVWPPPPTTSQPA